MISIVATSDLHGRLPGVPSADLLLLAGDLCPDGSSASQAKWLDTTFRAWLDKLPVRHVIAVAGNHDRMFATHPHLIPQNLKWHYLQDTSIQLLGLKIYGTPWQLPFWGAFNATDPALIERYASIESDTDIIISHGPPFGIGDAVPSYLDAPHHTGSLALRNRLLDIQPQLVVFGHIHEGFGTYQLETTVCANVSLLDQHMHEVNAPCSFKISPRHSPCI